MRRVALTRRRALVAGGSGVLAAAGVVAQREAGAAPSGAGERDALAFLLAVQRIEAAFYAAAVREGALDGDLAGFAVAAADHERRHVAVLERELGASASEAPEAPGVREALVRRPARFAQVAVSLEDIVTAASNGQAANLSPQGRAAVATIASVDARHAAWARELAGMPPAPDTTDGALPAPAVLQALRREGLLG